MKMLKRILVVLIIMLLITPLGYVVINGLPNSGKGKAENIKLGLDLAGGVSITYQTKEEVTAQELSDIVYKMQQRVSDYDGAQVYAEGDNRVTIEIPGVDNATEVLEELGKPGAIYFMLEYTEDGKTANFKYDKDKGEYVLARDLEEIIADGEIIITGNDIKSADAKFYQQQYQEPQGVVDFGLKESGTKAFGDATTLAYKKGWSIGIYYDGEFISVAGVSEPITTGSGIISGLGRDLTRAKSLATNIRIGALPVELEEITSQVVGASLGQEAIKTSLLGGAIGLVFLFIFMIVVYRVPGVAADIALVVYIGLMLLILNIYNLTLTLPGIAGIVLSIGMAVDANVIIFSRIKEELADEENTIRTAIKNGYKKALSAIVDGNVTTLLAAIVLGILGSGPVRGFAITLGVGILLSMISSLLVSRWVLLGMYHMGYDKEGMYGVAKERKSINFLGKRKIYFGISGVVIAIGLGFMVVNGAMGKGVFNFGLDFSGGAATNVTFDKEYTLDEVEDKIIPVIKEATGVTNVIPQIVKNSNSIVFKTQTLSVEQRNALNAALEKEFGLDVTDQNVVSYNNISATISNEMRRDAIIAVSVATVLMLIYIWIRFRDVKFAVSAIIALVHDVLIVLAFYAVSRTSVGNTFIACVLTILGYSINATIVIFDRIRENMEVMKKQTLTELVNSSVTSTLTRSIYTSVTTFIMVLFLFIVGVDSIREFTSPIMVGIIAGGFSSVCISGALWFIMKRASIRRMLKEVEE